MAKNTAQEIFNSHYFILFDSESDKGQEILISLLAKKHAICTAEFAKQNDSRDKFWDKVIEELKNM